MQIHNHCNHSESLKSITGSALMITAVVVMAMVTVSAVFLNDVIYHNKLVNSYETNYRLHYAAEAGLEQIKYEVTKNNLLGNLNTYPTDPNDSSLRMVLDRNTSMIPGMQISLKVRNNGSNRYTAISEGVNPTNLKHLYKVAIEIYNSPSPTNSPYSKYIHLQNTGVLAPLYPTLIRGDIFCNGAISLPDPGTSPGVVDRTYRYPYPIVDGNVFTPNWWNVSVPWGLIQFLNTPSDPYPTHQPLDWVVTGKVNGARPWTEQDVWSAPYLDVEGRLVRRADGVILRGNNPTPQSAITFPTIANIQALSGYAQSKYWVSYDNPYWKPIIDTVTQNLTYPWAVHVQYSGTNMVIGVRRPNGSNYWSPPAAGTYSETVSLPSNGFVYADKDIYIPGDYSIQTVNGRVTMATPGSVRIARGAQIEYVDAQDDRAYTYNPNPHPLNPGLVGYYEPNPAYNGTSVLGIIAGISIGQREPSGDAWSAGVLTFSGIAATGGVGRSVTNFIGSMATNNDGYGTVDLDYFGGGAIYYDAAVKNNPPPFFPELYQLAATGTISSGSLPTYTAYRMVK